MAADEKCPTCGGDGDQYMGTARGAVRHFMHRAIWQLHKLRQAADAMGAKEMSSYVSAKLKELEDTYERTFEDRRH